MNSHNPLRPKRAWAADDPRRRKVTAKKEGILDAALGVFLSDGFAGTSIERIAAAANVSKMTVYRHFDSKEALFLATINRHCDQIYDVEMHAPAASREEARAALREFGWTFINTIVAYDVMALWRMLVGEVSRFPEIGAHFYDVAPARTIEVITRILSGIMPIDVARARASAFMHMLMGDTHQRLILRKTERDDAMPDFGPHIELAVELVLGA